MALPSYFHSHAQTLYGTPLGPQRPRESVGHPSGHRAFLASTISVWVFLAHRLTRRYGKEDPCCFMYPVDSGLVSTTSSAPSPTTPSTASSTYSPNTNSRTSPPRRASISPALPTMSIPLPLPSGPTSRRSSPPASPVRRPLHASSSFWPCSNAPSPRPAPAAIARPAPSSPNASCGGWPPRSPPPSRTKRRTPGGGTGGG